MTLQRAMMISPFSTHDQGSVKSVSNKEFEPQRIMFHIRFNFNLGKLINCSVFYFYYL